MQTLGLTSRYFTFGAMLSLVLAVLAWGFREAPAAAQATLNQDIVSLSSAPFIDIFPLDCNGQINRPRLPPREKLSLPIYPGCEGKADYEERVICGLNRFSKFMNENTQQPTGSKRENVIVGFTIDKVTGLMHNLHIRRGADPRNREEALRVVKLLEVRGVRWTPATKEGVPFDANLAIPVSFHGARCGE